MHDIGLLVVKFGKKFGKKFFRILNSAILVRIFSLPANINSRLAQFASLDRVMGLFKFFKIKFRLVNCQHYSLPF